MILASAEKGRSPAAAGRLMSSSLARGAAAAAPPKAENSPLRSRETA